MSRAFVKEDDGEPERLPDRPQSSFPNYITPAGLAALRARVEEAARRGAAAPEGEAAKELKRDLRYLQERLARAIPVDNAGRPGDEVRFGAEVELEAGGSIRKVRLVGEDEADEGAGRIPWTSALGMALLGAKLGDEIDVGEGERAVVCAIRYPTG